MNAALNLGVGLSLAIATAAYGQGLANGDWEGYGRGIRWERSLVEAKARAVKEHKPILLYQLVGDLDKEGC